MGRLNVKAAVENIRAIWRLTVRVRNSGWQLWCKT